MDFRRIVLRVVGGVLGLLAGLWLTAIPACCCTSADVMMSGPSVLEVCEVAEYVAAGQPQGGDYQWSAGVGEIVSGQGTSQIQYKAPDDPEVGSVVISVTYSVPCPDDPNETIHAGTSMVVAITPKDCTNGGASGLDILVRVNPPPVHIADLWDAERLTAVGIDPDLTDCGCKDVSADGMDLEATVWDAPAGNLEFDPPVGRVTWVYSRTATVGLFPARATFHDKASPSWADDNEGNTWTATKYIQTFRVGSKVNVVGGGTYTLYETDSVTEGGIAVSMKNMYKSVFTTGPQTGSGFQEDSDWKSGTFLVVTEPSDLDIKKDITGYARLSHNAGSCRVGVADTDLWPSGTISCRISAAGGLVSISFSHDFEDDDAVGLASIGYGASLEGAGFRDDVKIEKRSGGPFTWYPLVVPAWSTQTSYGGKPGEPGSSIKGEIRCSMRIDWWDNSTSDLLQAVTSWFVDDGTLNDIRFWFYQKPIYGP